jgi:hypothetical protein
MPYIIRPKGPRRFVATLIGAVLLACAVPAAADAACPSNPVSALLASFGDNSSYTLLQGSSFESGAPGWSLNNAEVLGGEGAGAEGAGAEGASGEGASGEGASGEGTGTEGANGDSYSLAIAPGGSAVSPQFCVSSEYPSFRFFARETGGGGGWGSSLKVSLRWAAGYWREAETPVASLQPNGAWTLSPSIALAGALPLRMPGSTLKVRLVFRPSGGTSWAIDNVYIDPYSR